MNIRTLAGLCVISLVMFSRAEAAPEKYKIDPSHTVLALLVDHVGFSKVLGRFTEVEGSFTYDDETGELSDLIVEVKSKSFASDNKARDKHVRGKDFLSVKKHPSMSFTTSNSITITDGAGDIEGQFEMLGKTLPLTLQANLNKAAKYPFGHKKFTLGITARGAIERSQYGMDYGVKAGLVGDSVELIIETEAIRQ